MRPTRCPQIIPLALLCLCFAACAPTFSKNTLRAEKPVPPPSAGRLLAVQ